jgi:hypothetical protein
MSMTRDAQALLARMGLEGDGGEAPRRQAGRGSAVTDEEALDIRVWYLADGMNFSQIARKTGRTRETVAQVIKDPATDALRTIIHEEKVQRAKAKLRAHVDTAAEAWVRAVDIAADKGDHKPAKELLLTERVIDPVGEPSAAFQVIVNQPGSPHNAPLPQLPTFRQLSGIDVSHAMQSECDRD